MNTTFKHVTKLLYFIIKIISLQNKNQYTSHYVFEYNYIVMCCDKQQ